MIGHVFKVGRKWHVSYTTWPSNKRKKKAVSPVKAEALHVLAAARKAYIEGRFFDVSPSKSISFEDAARKYLEWAKTNTKSHDRYETSYKSLRQTFGKMTLAEIDVQSIDAWRSQRIRSVTPATCNRDLFFLKGMFKRARIWRLTKEDPTKMVSRLHENNMKLIFLTDGEKAELLKCCADHLRPIVRLALVTGMRRSELLNLRWEHVDRHTQWLLVSESKSKKQRGIPLNDEAMLALREATSYRHIAMKSPYVFCNKGGEPYAKVTRSFETALRKAGLADRGFTFHALRHSFASDLVNRGESVYVVAELLGHSDVRMVSRYAHLTQDTKRRAVEKLMKSVQVLSKTL